MTSPLCIMCFLQQFSSQHALRHIKLPSREVSPRGAIFHLLNQLVICRVLWRLLSYSLCEICHNSTQQSHIAYNFLPTQRIYHLIMLTRLVHPHEVKVGQELLPSSLLGSKLLLSFEECVGYVVSHYCEPSPHQVVLPSL